MQLYKNPEKIEITGATDSEGNPVNLTYTHQEDGTYTKNGEKYDNFAEDFLPSIHEQGVELKDILAKIEDMAKEGNLTIFDPATNETYNTQESITSFLNAVKDENDLPHSDNSMETKQPALGESALGAAVSAAALKI